MTDDVILRADAGQAGDPSNGVRVDHEVLPEVAPRCQVVVVEQRCDVAARMHAYQLIRTGTGASARSLIDVNRSVWMTMSTPSGSAPPRVLTHVMV